jgi:DNA (cytosine-5)-methyltransferase 1
LALFSETWPRSGLVVAGIAYLLPPLVRLTDEIDYGLWATPMPSDVDGGRTTKGQHRQNETGLRRQVMAWPTPTSRDWKDGSQKACANVPRNGLLGRAIHEFPTPGGTRPNDADQVSGRLANEIGGALNPTWVEWLMGFPLGWTALEASAMPWSPRYRKSSDGQ